jgi:putative chitinase
MSDFILTQQQLAQFLPGNPYLDHWYHALEQALPDYDINTPTRVAAFLAQCAHESGGFKFLKENLNYKAESLSRVWPKYFKDPVIAKQYAHNQEMIANRAYGGRMGNGPEASGDGWKFCGRGLIQLTGRSNYQSFADSIETDINDIPEYLQTFEGAVQSACWFWENNNLNKWADAGDVEKMTKIINGGTLGLEDRKKHYQHALHILGA